MKNSTKLVSSKNKKDKSKNKSKNKSKDKTKKKPLVRTLGGLVFYPKLKKTRTDIFYSVAEWIEAKKPDNVYIHDALETLNTANIEIVDAVCHRGVYTKTIVRPMVTTTVNKIGLRNLHPRQSPTMVKTMAGIHVADVRDHHKMVY